MEENELRCPNCGEKMSPVYFMDEEFDEHMIKTGRKRLTVNYLLCEYCGKKEIVDDSFMAHEWHY